jgi:hypothetical protein
MKKVALSLLAFALVGAGAFADAAADVVKAPVTFSLNAEGSASFGYDLDTGIHGFTQAVTSKVTLWFLNGSTTNTGAGDIHGSITAADVKYGTDDNSTVPALSFGDVTAKIVAGDLYVKLSSGKTATPGSNNAAQSYARDVDNDNGGSGTSANDTFKNYAGRYGADTEWNDSAIAGYSSFDGKGIEVGYTIPGTLSFVGVVDSQDDWQAAKQSDYETSVSVNLLSVEKLTLGGKFYKSTDLTAAGAEFAYDLGAFAPFANLNYGVTKSDYAADFGSKLAPVDGLLAVVWGQYNSKGVFNAEATFSLASGKLAGPLSADVGVRAKDVTNAVAAKNATNEIFAKVGFKASDVVSVYGSVDTYNAAGSTDSSLFAKAGLDFTGISLTTISLNWDSSDLGAAKTTATAANGKESKTGKFVVTAKIKL